MKNLPIIFALAALAFSCSKSNDSAPLPNSESPKTFVWHSEYNTPVQPGISPTIPLTKPYTIVGDSVELIGILSDPLVIYLPADESKFMSFEQNPSVKTIKSYGACHRRSINNSFVNLDSTYKSPNGSTGSLLKSNFNVTQVENNGGKRIVHGECLVYTSSANKISYYNVQYVIEIDNFVK